MTPERFRREALALPGAVEGAHHGHPDFRAHGRVFASLHPDGERAMMRVPVPVQQRLVAAQPDVCATGPGAWGRAGCTMVLLADAPLALVRDALTEAWQFAAAAVASAKQEPGARARPGARTRPKKPRR